tara:strand:+ start:584 stop:1129 length:546 start_codon:yes stop_codon:yes gene_type:complete
MGFDVYGLRPETDVVPDQPNWSQNNYDEEQAKAYFAWQENTPGAYFRNNVWWWRPLWNYVSFMCNDILTDEDIDEGCMNSGHRISKTKAKKIAARLRKLDKQGHTKEYELERNESLDDLKMEECDLCKGTGLRNDEYVQGKCNGCDGIGEKKPFIAEYPFNVKNVRDFAHFCDKSGGFEIC